MTSGALRDTDSGLQIMHKRYSHCAANCFIGSSEQKALFLTRRELPPIWKKSAATLILSWPSTSCHTLWIFSSSGAARVPRTPPQLLRPLRPASLARICVSVFSFLRSTCASFPSCPQQVWQLTLQLGCM